MWRILKAVRPFLRNRKTYLLFWFVLVEKTQLAFTTASESRQAGWEKDANQVCAHVESMSELDREWDLRVPTGNRPNNHTRRQPTSLPELEPMLLEPPFYQHHQQQQGLQTKGVRLSLPHGAVARLPCPVRQLGNRTVSWLKHSANANDHIELLTLGNSTYSSDSRLVVSWRYPGNWTLQIDAVTLSDSGCYQCTINTHPPLGIAVHLHVRGPAVTVVDDRNVSVSEAVFKQGAVIRLVCLIQQADSDTFPVQWKSNDQAILNHDTHRGGVSVKTDRRGRNAVSWLMMARATSRDSGVYTCAVGSHQANVTVHVIQGEHQAAVQEMATTGCATCNRDSSVLSVLTISVAIYVLFPYMYTTH